MTMPCVVTDIMLVKRINRVVSCSGFELEKIRRGHYRWIRSKKRAEGPYLAPRKKNLKGTDPLIDMAHLHGVLRYEDSVLFQ